MDDTSWKGILGKVKEKSPSLGGLLCSSKLVNIDGDKLNLSVYYKFHKDKLEEEKNRRVIEESCFELLSKQIKLEVTLINEQPETAELEENNNQNITLVAEQIFA